MADIRSMLRNELASRGSSAQAGHTGRVTKKRKIEELGSNYVAPKKSRPTTPAYVLPPGHDNVEESDTAGPDQKIAEEEGEGGEEEEEDKERLADESRTRPATTTNETVAASGAGPSDKSQLAQPSDTAKQSIDEDEWAAFERDVVAPTRVAPVPTASVVVSAATISAAPMTAEELAAQQQKNREERVAAQEADIEGEMEDAARHLEEEFEEMEQLEERVKRLKAKREQIRAQKTMESNGVSVDDMNTSQQDGEEDEDDEQDADEDWDDWRFR